MCEMTHQYVRHTYVPGIHWLVAFLVQLFSSIFRSFLASPSCRHELRSVDPVITCMFGNFWMIGQFIVQKSCTLCVTHVEILIDPPLPR